jgi:hypothetical protein
MISYRRGLTSASTRTRKRPRFACRLRAGYPNVGPHLLPNRYGSDGFLHIGWSQLRDEDLTSHQRSSKSFSLARSFQHADHGNVRRADPTVKLEALESAIAPKLRSGRFKATDKLIASLRAGSFMRSEKAFR